jgi:hypothetical protein
MLACELIIVCMPDDKRAGGRQQSQSQRKRAGGQEPELLDEQGTNEKDEFTPYEYSYFQYKEAQLGNGKRDLHGTVFKANRAR